MSPGRGSLAAKGQQRGRARREQRASRETESESCTGRGPFPPGLTCPGAAREFAQVQVWSPLMSPPPHWESWMGAGAPHSLPLRTRQQPHPGWPRPLPHLPPRNPRTAGHRAFTGFICFSGKVNYTGLSHIESRGGSKGTSAEALSSRAWRLEEGGGPCHCGEPPQRGTLLPPSRGRAETGRAGFPRPLHGSAEARGGLSLGTRQGGPQERGPRWGMVILQLTQERVCERLWA